MKELFSTFTIYDWLLTAILAYFVTSIILRISILKESIKKMKQRQMISIDYKIMDLERLMAKCRELFPIDTIYFQGRVFHRGMKIRITTIQKKVIEGELIGKSKMDLLCIKTQNQIIAHELDKIEEMEQL